MQAEVVRHLAPGQELVAELFGRVRAEGRQVAHQAEGADHPVVVVGREAAHRIPAGQLRDLGA